MRSGPFAAWWSGLVLVSSAGAQTRVVSPGGALHGAITNAVGQAGLSYALVTVVGADRRAFANEQGRFLITGLKPGARAFGGARNSGNPIWSGFHPGPGHRRALAEQRANRGRVLPSTPSRRAENDRGSGSGGGQGANPTANNGGRHLVALQPERVLQGILNESLRPAGKGDLTVRATIRTSQSRCSWFDHRIANALPPAGR